MNRKKRELELRKAIFVEAAELLLFAKDFVNTTMDQGKKKQSSAKKNKSSTSAMINLCLRL